MASDPNATGYPEGSRWLHVWPERYPQLATVCVAFQVETVGVKITPAPYVEVTPTEAALLLKLLRSITNAVANGEAVSIPLDGPAQGGA